MQKIEMIPLRKFWSKMANDKNARAPSADKSYQILDVHFDAALRMITHVRKIKGIEKLTPRGNSKKGLRSYMLVNARQKNIYFIFS